MKKHPEITGATRIAFVDAFCVLYANKPIEKISIQELADKAGYNRTTFYHYFEDIYGLLTYLEDLVITHIKKNIIPVIQSNRVEQEFLNTFIKMYAGQEPYIKVLINHPYGTRFIDRLKNEMLDTFIETFRLPKSNVKSVFILDFYLSGVLSVISRWIRNQDVMPLSNMGEFMREMATKTILPQLSMYSSVKTAGSE